jgi:3-oxoacyl-[acyl-carrier protein] reductase
MSSRVAFVTSAGKGLGHAMVLAFAKAGWDIAFTYGTSEREAKELVSLVQVMGQQALALPCDLFEKASVLEAVARAKERFTYMDALVHNFGPFVFDKKPVADYNEDMWQHMIDGNLTNFLWLYQTVVHDMRSRRFGRLITVGYDGAGSARGWHSFGAYAAAKAGLASLTRTIAEEERTYGITANMVCPGDIRGRDKMKMIDEVDGRLTNEGLRPAVGEDVARAVVWMCHADSQEVNGTVLEITGAREFMAKDVATAQKGSCNER